MLSDIENLDIMLGENQVMSPKMKTETEVGPREILTLGRTPNVTAILSQVILALK